jgi:hypothetical protein
VKEAEKYENTLLSVKYAVVEFTNTWSKVWFLYYTLLTSCKYLIDSSYSDYFVPS